MGRDSFKIQLIQENIIHNFNYIREHTQKEIIAVVKVNAYGHGLKEVVRILVGCGCNYFAVARESEALEILSLNIPSINILIFETIEDFSLLKKYKNLEVVINSIDELLELIKEKINFSQLHLKFDFGFARNGFIQNEIETIKNIVIKNNLHFKGAMTHFFNSDFNESIEIQNRSIESIKYIGDNYFDIIHSQNSAATLLGLGDGFSKKNTNILCHINNKEYPIVHISMDTSFVLIDDSVNLGDIVEIYKNFDSCSSFLNMNHYEYTTLINSRIPRFILK